INENAHTDTATYTRTHTHTVTRSEEHTSELQSHLNLVCRLLLEKKKYTSPPHPSAHRHTHRTTHPPHAAHTRTSTPASTHTHTLTQRDTSLCTTPLFF